jgi:hypothetical protein
MAVTQIYDVTWHAEINGKMCTPGYQQDFVQAAANDYNTLKGVIITNQGKSLYGGTFVIDNIANVGPGNIEQ